ncbi:MAG: bifunctional phosphoribosyl-AMP cyclohydrolase/phosphoribosyl-ATP diphosphatase HisIE [Acidobacteriota bacterium]|nr:bifunctional phosphoribosyl-AMP cyclohydrolase/phosphoribosyl-ATP diphosphatase HisIE [Acidobacteriota bacterium]
MKAQIQWNEAGLVPAVVQDAASGRVLMLAWMNEEALSRTIESGRVHFWSRSRRTLWKKGETSGNELHLRSLTADCDGDVLLVQADPTGPACHTGRTSCFFERVTEGGGTPEPAPDPDLGTALSALTRIVRERAASRPEGSYTAALLKAGIPRIAQKVGEEAVEVSLAAVSGSAREVVNESVDLVYHLLVLLEALGIDGREVAAEITRRFPAKGS